MWIFLSLLIATRVPWNYNRGHWAVQAVSVKVGSHPGNRFLLKPGEEKSDCFMEGKEKHTHTHTLALFSLSFSYSHIWTFSDAWRERGTETYMHSFSQGPSSYLTSSMYPIYPFTWSHSNLHTLSPIHCPSFLHFFNLANERLKQAKLLQLQLEKIC